MPLVVCPTCHTQLQIPDGMGGKKARCTKCQNIFAVAATPPAAAPRPVAAAPRPAVAPARNPAASAPRPAPNLGIQPAARRPAGVGGNGIQQPLPPTMPLPPMPMRGYAPPRRKSGPPVALLLVFFLLVLGGSVFGGWWFFLRDSGKKDNAGNNTTAAPTIDVTYFPDKTSVVASGRLADLLSSPVVEKLRKDDAKVDSALKRADKFKSDVGIELADIATMDVCFAMDEGVGIVHTNKKYTAEILLENAKGTKFEKVKDSDPAIYQKVGSKSAFCVVDPNTIVVSNLEPLKKILKRKAAPELSPEIKAAIKAADFSNTLVVAVDVSELKKSPQVMKMLMGVPGIGPKGGNPLGGNPFGKLDAGLPQAQFVAFAEPDKKTTTKPAPESKDDGLPEYALIECNLGSELTIKASAFFKDEKAATAIKEKLDKVNLANFLTMMPMPVPLPSEVTTKLKELKYDVSGARLSAQISLDAAPLAKSLKVQDHLLALATPEKDLPPPPPPPPPPGKSDFAEDLKYLSDKSNLIGRMEVSQLLASPILQQLQKDNADFFSSFFKADESAKNMGIPVSDIVSAAFSTDINDPNSTVVIVRTSKGYTVDAILANMGKQGMMKPKQVGAHTLHIGGAKEPMALCLIDGKTVLYSSPAVLEPVLMRNGPPRLSADMKAAIDSADFSNTITVVVNAKEIPNLKAAEIVPGTKLPPADFASLQIKADSNLMLKGSAQFADAKSATDTKSIVDSFLAIGRLNKGTPASVLPILNSLKSSANGNKLVIESSVDAPMLTKILQDPAVMVLFKKSDPGPNPKPVVDPPPVSKSGPFIDVRPIEPGQTVTYLLTTKANAQYELEIRSPPSASLATVISAKGVPVVNDPAVEKHPRTFNWTAPAADVYEIKIKNEGKEPRNCALNLTEKGGSPPPPPPVVVKKEGPFTDFRAVKPTDAVTYEFPVQANQPANFIIKGPADGADLDVKVKQNGAVVALDAGKKSNFDLAWTPLSAGTTSVEITAKNAAAVNVEFKQTPPLVAMKKPVPYSDLVAVQPGQTLAYEFMVKPGSNMSLLVNSQSGPANFTITIKHDGKLVANAVGPKENFVLTFGPTAPAGAIVEIKSNDKVERPCTIDFKVADGGINPPPPPLPNVIVKAGPFLEQAFIKSGGVLTYQFPVQAGQATFSAKTTFPMKMDIKLMQNGKIVAQDSGLKMLYNLTWNAKAGPVEAVLTSKDNLDINATVSLKQGGVVNPPDQPPAGVVLNTTGLVGKGGAAKFHTLSMKAGVTYTLRLNTQSPGYDPYLWLYDPTGKEVAHDDDSGGFPNAKIVYTPTTSGLFKIKCGSFANSSGKYNLIVESAGGGGGGPVDPPGGGNVDFQRKNGKLINNKAFVHTQRLEAGVTYTVSGSASFFLHMEIKDGPKTLQNNSFVNQMGSLTFTPTETKNYQIVVRDAVNRNSGTFTLTISH